VPVDDKLRREYREALGLEYKQIVFLTGGGNGARMLNEALVANARYLLGTFPNLALVHVAGRSLEAETNAAYDSLKLGVARGRVFVHGFVTGLYRYSGAADVVIARGGATNLAEFAQQGTACLIVPSKQLGWNVKNAAALAARQMTGNPEKLDEGPSSEVRLLHHISALVQDSGICPGNERSLALDSASGTLLKSCNGESPHYARSRSSGHDTSEGRRAIVHPTGVQSLRAARRIQHDIAPERVR